MLVSKRPNLVLINKRPNLALISKRPYLVLINKRPNLVLINQSPNLVLINKKKRTCHLVGLAVLLHHKLKMEEFEKIDKYLNLSSEAEKTLEHEGYVIPIIYGALRTVPTG